MSRQKSEVGQAGAGRKRVEGTAVALDRSSVDTDAMYPMEFNAAAIANGRQIALFGIWRRDDPQFCLNRPGADRASVLVAGPEFGIGSSREMAVWALRDWGFKAVIAPSFGQIFRLNCGQNGIVAATVSPRLGRALLAALDGRTDHRVLLDLEARAIEVDGDQVGPFDMDDFARRQIIQGVTELDLILAEGEEIARYETTRPAWLPSTVRIQSGGVG